MFGETWVHWLNEVIRYLYQKKLRAKKNVLKTCLGDKLVQEVSICKNLEKIGREKNGK